MTNELDVVYPSVLKFYDISGSAYFASNLLWLFITLCLCFDHVIQEYKVFVDDGLVGITTDNIFVVQGLIPGDIFVVMITSYSNAMKGGVASITVHTPPATPSSVKEGRLSLYQ